MLEADEEGNTPSVGQFPGADPAGYVKILSTYADIMAGEMGLPVSMLGQHSDGNPASADAIRAGYEELTSRARMKQTTLAGDHEQIMQLALMVKHGVDALPENAHRIETDWRSPAPETPAGTTDAVTKQIAAGAIPATSDVTLKRLGYSAVERLQLAQDRKDDGGLSMLQEIAHNLQARALKTDTTVIKDASNPSATGAPKSAAPTPAVMPRKVPVSDSRQPQ
jgi:hypothetical protein